MIADLYSVHLPPFSEQAKIAAFLSGVDARIAQLERKFELLKDYKRGAVEKIFTREFRFRDTD